MQLWLFQIICRELNIAMNEQPKLNEMVLQWFNSASVWVAMTWNLLAVLVNHLLPARFHGRAEYRDIFVEAEQAKHQDESQKAGNGHTRCIHTTEQQDLVEWHHSSWMEQNPTNMSRNEY